MVLGNQLKIAALIYGLLCLISVQAFGQDLDEVNWGGKELKLSDIDGVCTLKIDDQEVPVSLGVGVPCYFQRSGDEFQIYSFSEFKNVTIAVVAGTIVSAERRKDYNLDETEICLSNAQGLVLSTSRITATDRVAWDGLWCRNIGMDRKFFYGFAASK
ncbi:hypothetical protein [Roseibium sp.]|uniref:hypothetical protein n=1 Tax=Roseibium sp. TaxID=1936156 RepID=UPI003B52B260